MKEAELGEEEVENKRGGKMEGIERKGIREKWTRQDEIYSFAYFLLTVYFKHLLIISNKISCNSGHI